MKTVVYAGTRNLYRSMVSASISLLEHTPVDRIYFLIEDDTFPMELPEQIRTVNVSQQTYFPPSGPNSRTEFTYMAMMRVCYSKLFPKLNKILQLDVDTIVTDDLSPLWEIDLEGKWFAAVHEAKSNYRPLGPKYYNIGVAMFNLKQIRKDHADDAAIRFLNEKRVSYIDQDAWNILGQEAGKDAELPVRYNESIVTGSTNDPAVVHYAGYREWQNRSGMFRGEILEKYRDRTWEEILHG